jgi:SAM-dependent methyltransferase
MSSPAEAPEAAAARETVASHPAWYHVIDVAPGVTTPGVADLRDFAPRALPEDLTGKRCLDVGTFDGFWAFQMERRNAQEVVAIDLAEGKHADWPPNTRAEIERVSDATGAEWGDGFRIAKELLESRAERVICSVYELSPERIGGPVDFALCGTLLQHLRDPVAALERVGETLAPGGDLLLIETYSAPLTRRHRSRPIAEFRPAVPSSLFTWWVPNLATLHGWAGTAGFHETGPAVTGYKPRGAGRDDRLAAISLQRSR